MKKRRDSSVCGCLVCRTYTSGIIRYHKQIQHLVHKATLSCLDHEMLFKCKMTWSFHPKSFVLWPVLFTLLISFNTFWGLLFDCFKGFWTANLEKTGSFVEVLCS